MHRTCARAGEHDAAFPGALHGLRPPPPLHRLVLEPEELPQLEAVVSHWRMVHRGEYLYRSGDKFQNLYTVRSGSLKTVATHAGGHERHRLLPAGRNGRPWRDWRRRV
jgi:CRP-like cAMP-binding protein